jgi:hypothetical protein
MMAYMRAIYFVTVLLSVFGIVTANDVVLDHDRFSTNSVYVFNAIVDSVRQWGSSFHYNGMSVFAASVPAGTEFYHGSTNNIPVTGMEWLAFEPEHAQQFGFIRYGNRSDPPQGSKKKRSSPVVAQQVLGLDLVSNRVSFKPGYLHTYITKHDLRLLYLDGMSGGKTTNGTLDMQDFIVIPSSVNRTLFGDYDRAHSMCKIASEEWNKEIHGFLRMEAGFEIILCDFSKHLDVRRITRSGQCSEFAGNCKQNELDATVFGAIRAISDRYFGIGGNRIHINIHKFFTAYAYNVQLWASGQDWIPRLNNLSPDILQTMRADLTKFILAKPSAWDHKGPDWQAIADLIVTRYAPRLKYLSQLELACDSTTLLSEIKALVGPFIDYEKRSPHKELRRCGEHFLPDAGPSLAAHSIRNVSYHICQSLFTALQQPKEHDCHSQPITRLMKMLDWAIWKECGPCAANEFCFIPMWPHGEREDWENPSCTNATRFKGRRGFWETPAKVTANI